MKYHYPITLKNIFEKLSAKASPKTATVNNKQPYFL